MFSIELSMNGTRSCVMPFDAHNFDSKLDCIRVWVECSIRIRYYSPDRYFISKLSEFQRTEFICVAHKRTHGRIRQTRPMILSLPYKYSSSFYLHAMHAQQNATWIKPKFTNKKNKKQIDKLLFFPSFSDGNE